MKTLFALFVAAMTLASAQAFAGDITVNHAWARASAGMAKAGAAFMMIKNEGGSDKVLSAKADVSAKVELHTHIMDGEIMRMRQVDSIDVAGGAVTKLAPGGLHVMLIGLKAPLKEGDSFPMTLVFEKAGEIAVDVKVKKPGAMGAHKGHDEGGHHEMEDDDDDHGMKKKHGH